MRLPKKLPKLPKITPRVRRFALYQVGLLVVVLLGFMVAGNAMVNRHQTCQMCHEMNTVVGTWQASSHEKILCTQCHHKKPGYYGFILGIPHKITDGVTHMMGAYEEPIQAKSSIQNEVCQQCHVSWRNVSPSGDLVIPHEKHFKKAKLACVRCHADVVHGEQTEGKFMRRPPMELCLSCHGGGSNTAPTLTCKKCHTEKAVPSNHKKDNWFAMHGTIAKDPKNPDEQCRRCHGWTTDFCNACHAGKRPSTHYGGEKWRSFHAIRAKADKTGCFVCHNEKSFCQRCHDPFKN
ncbi:MAG TPA: hypothetical protein VGK02_10045 [Candidatus Aquicultor sp.]|jgi:hypothetical protein